MKNLLLYFLFLLSYAAQSFAQDANFSRYTGDPLGLNPALSGVIPVQARRLALSYRNQWSSFLKSDAFVTKAVSFDNRLCVTESNDFFGWGATVQYDGNGYPAAQPMLSRLKAAATGSFVKQLSSNRYSRTWRMAGGAEIGLIQNWLNQDNLEYYIQFEEGVFNSNLIGESIAAPSNKMFDVGAGIFLYSTNNRNNQPKEINRTSSGLNFGISVKHINRPAYKFFPGSKATLNPRWAFHTAWAKELATNKLSIRFTPYFFWQKPYYQAALMGETLLHLNTSHFYTHIGGGIRRSGHAEKSNHTDALIFYTRMDFGNYTFSISYDINISPLHKATNYKGAFEFSMLKYFGKSNCECNCDCPY